MAKIKLIDGNNQFFIKYAKATSYADLVRRCQELNWGFDQVYWVFDGYDSRKPRRDIYPEYKNTASRAKNKLDTTKYDMLNDFKKVDLPNLGGVVIIEMPQIEADDVIRKLAMTLADGKNQIEIASNDVDLLNLSDLPLVTQPQAKLPANVGSGKELDLYKTLVGDSSDNIKGLAGFGDAAWAKLTQEQRASIQYQLEINTERFMKMDCFDFNVKHEAKLAEKIYQQWDTVKMFSRVVNYIEIKDDDLLKFIKVFPPKAPVKSGKLLTMD